jgi:flagella basal body P-ring formation protein FlgA
MSKTLLAFAACLALAPALSHGETLAAAAESFVEASLSLPAGSARAHSVDPKLALGDCESGWVWSFPYESRNTVQVTCTDAGHGGKRFVGISLPTRDSMDRQPVAAAPQPAAIVVAARDLAYGHVLGGDDLTTASPPPGRLLAATLTDPQSLIGQTLTRPVRRGEVLGRADARSHLIVRRNAVVSAWSEFSGGRVVSKLVALQNGRAGDWIELENPQSGRQLRGQIQTDGSVRLGQKKPVATSTLASTKVPASTVD